MKKYFMEEVNIVLFSGVSWSQRIVQYRKPSIAHVCGSSQSSTVCSPSVCPAFLELLTKPTRRNVLHFNYYRF